MKTSSHSDQTSSKGGSEDPALQNLSADEKKALELKEHAEHETGVKREKLQKEAVAKTK